MPDILDVNGLQTKTFTELRTELVIAFQAIYGNDINVDQNSPDGQQIDIFTENGVDIREVLTQINAGFDPDQAIGRVLDQRVAINGITRNEGTYTFQNVEITTDRALNLIGLDSQSNELDPSVPGLYSVKDDAGTIFHLLDSQSIIGPGTFSFNFRAATIGQVEVIVNTITTPETVLAGVTGINNPSSANSIGQNEEKDSELKQRRRISTAIASIGNLDGLEAALKGLDGVTTALAEENDTKIVDSNGTEPNTIWCIVEGGDDVEIATVIYSRKTTGCGMRGDQVVSIPRTNNRFYAVKFDRPGNEDLYIRASLSIPGESFNPDDVKEAIVNNVIWGVGEDAEASVITCFLKEYNPNFKITGVEVSKDGVSWDEIVSVDLIKNRFLNDVSRIIIT